MKQKPRKEPVKRSVASAPKKKPERPQVSFGVKNYAMMGVGLVAIIIGYITLAGGSITLAPLLLVLGYCVIIPLGLLLR
ncbi:MAG TPA: hypothetical protein ENN51_01265 [candidate division WOR-3 bacterium]|uniref:DUF3098 domain-containing protein n=1 Tax=candidate division WOR-3 bacterium TaxID=2052148 RepID=A0A7V0T4R2_UNCW3|nr:hypothetical protein [candidate division WOR-3 bacterium]